MFRTNPQILEHIVKLYSDDAKNEYLARKTFYPGQFLLKQDEKLTKAYIIETGIVKCFISEENDKEFIVEFLGEGQIIGELETIRPRTALCTVAPLTQVTAISIAVPYLDSLLGKDVVFNRLVMQELADRIINSSSRAASQQLYTLNHELSRLLALQQQYQFSISKPDMAAYLGVSIRSLNRALQQLEE